MEHEHPAWELGMSLFLILVGIAVIVLSTHFPKMDDGQPGPSLFPQVLAGGMILGGLSLVWGAVKDLRRPVHVPFLASRSGLIKVFATLLIGGLVPVLMPYITLTGAAALASAVFCVLIGTDPLRSVGVGAFTAATIFFLFGKLLGVPLS